MTKRVYEVRTEGELWMWACFPVKGEGRIFWSRQGDDPYPPAYMMKPEEWPKPRIEFFAEGRSKANRKVADFTQLTVAEIAASRRAKEQLSDMLDDTVDWLPLNADQGEYYWPRVNRIVDCLDLEASDCEYYEPGSDEMRDVHHWVFRDDLVPEQGLFTLPQFRSRVYATEAFVKAVRDAGLTGLEFKLIYPVPKPEPVIPGPKPEPAEEFPTLATKPMPKVWQEQVRALSKDMAAVTSAQLVKDLKNELNRLRSLKLRRSDLSNAAKDLGLRFALLLAGELDWQLAWGRYEELDGPVVVSADGMFAVFPVAFVSNLLSDKSAQNKLELVLNMLIAGQLPPKPAKGAKLIW